MVMQSSGISFKGVKALLIDLDNTLYAYDACHQRALEACSEKGLLEMKDRIKDTQAFCEGYNIHRGIVRDRLYPQGACRSRLLTFLSYFESLHVKMAYEQALRFDELYWQTFMSHMMPLPAAQDLLQAAHDAKVKVVVITDMLTTIQIRKLSALAMGPFIDAIVTSEEAGAEKPHPAIFALALAKGGATPWEAIMVGDDFEKDIVGAKNMGIRAYRITLSGELREHAL